MATPASKFQPLPDEDAPPGRSPYDAIGMRDRVYTQTLDAMVKAPPVSDGQFSLRLKAPRYVDPPTYTPAQEKQAILGGTTLGRRVKGTWELLNDTTGEVLDSRTQIVARVPYVNDRGLIIHRGSHYAVANQPRLLPGIFVRTRSNGEPDVHVNTLPGNGVGHHYTLDQAKGMLNVRVGQSQAPLAPLLRLMGATDEEMKAAWGEDLFKSSTKDMPGPALKRLRQAFLRRPDASDDELLAKITSTQLSPDVTSRTLGAPLEKLDKHAVLAATRRLIALSRGEDEGDDRDDPSFQRVYSPEDLFSERIAKDSGYVRKRALQEAVRQGGSLKKLPSGLLTSQLEHVLLKSGLGQSLEETNALEALDKMTRVTRLGEGGIPSTQSIPPESRDVRPSQFGYVDHVRTPECYDLGTEVMTRRGWLYYTDLKDTDEVACLVQGRVEWFVPSAKVDYHYRGPMYSIRANGVDLLVTPEHRIFMLSVSETPLSFSPDGAWKVEEAWRAFSYPSFLLLCAGPAESNWLGMPIAAAQDSSTVGATVCVRKQHMSVRQDYEGTVWCLTVPGGLLYVRRRGENGGRGVWCGNSLRVGVDAFLANGVRKGDDGRLYARYRDARTGQMVWRTPNQISGLAVAVPGAGREKSDRIQVIRNGKWDYVNRKDVDLMPGPYQDYFSPLANLVPFTSAEKAHRLAMGSRMLTQALPLENAEAPLVQNAIPGTKGMRSYDEEFAPHAGAVRAAKDGRVIHVTDDSIFVRYADGKDSEIPLYRNHPNNRKTLLHQSPVVTEGQEFKAGQSLVRSNYTDPTGNAIAIGRNLRVAFLPFRGKNFEDATVISESGASALSSEHAYQHSLDPDPSLTQDRAKYLSLFATKHPREKLEALDEKGVVKPGRRVEYGDPLILAVKQRAQDGSRILKRGSPSWSDAAVTWEHEDPGVVTDVVYGKHGPTVLVRSISAAKVGDKLSGRHGNKAIIADIIPDEQMPRDEQGRPFHVLLGPEGVTTRANPAQKYEMWLGKIAEKTGKPIKVEDFGDTGDLQEWVQKKLAMHGLSSTETVTDPETERPIKGVATGNMWLMKLGHMAESKEQARSGGSYTADDTPGKGGYAGCFAPKQRIVTHLGMMRIASICEKRLGVQVRTFSEPLQEWVFRPVTDWFTYRARVADMLTVHLGGGICEKDSQVARTHSCLHATRNHVVLTYDRGRTTVGDLTPADRLVTWGPVLTSHQREFLYGTLLGDASASYTAVQFAHSLKQVNYANWKKLVLSGLCPHSCDYTHKHDHHPTFITKRVRARHIWLSTDYVCRELTDVCYPGGKKIVTPAWLSQLSDLSIAAWVLDDGSITNRAKKKGKTQYSGNIATHGFDPASRQLLCDWLNARLGTHCVVNGVGAIALTADACRKIVNIVAEWVPVSAIPRSKRFVRKQVAALQELTPPRRIDTTCRMGKVPLRITGIEPYKHDKPHETEINVYDFTVDDTHTYLAGHALVSNSKRLGLLNVNSLMSHGAYEVLREAGSIRGTRSEDFWQQFMRGESPREPGEPTVYRKFFDNLHAAGVRVYRDKRKLHLLGLTRDDVHNLTGDRVLTRPDTVRLGSLDPVAGGLFDKGLTGSHGGCGPASTCPSPCLRRSWKNPCGGSSGSPGTSTRASLPVRTKSRASARAPRPSPRRSRSSTWPRSWRPPGANCRPNPRPCGTWLKRSSATSRAWRSTTCTRGTSSSTASRCYRRRGGRSACCLRARPRWPTRTTSTATWSAAWKTSPRPSSTWATPPALKGWPSTRPSRRSPAWAIPSVARARTRRSAASCSMSWATRPSSARCKGNCFPRRSTTWPGASLCRTPRWTWTRWACRKTWRSIPTPATWCAGWCGRASSPWKPSRP